MIALTSKCYFADSGKDEGVKKFSCKGVSQKTEQNELGEIQKCTFRVT